MLQIQRQEQILQLLSEHTALRIGALAKLLFTSEATVRRDLCEMEKSGLVQRVYGGVTLKREQLPLEMRTQENAGAKREIAARAAAYIHDGDTVFLDASSTVQHLLPHLDRFRDLTVITNSQRVMERLAGGKHRLVCVGGELHRRNMAFVGPLAERMLEGLAPAIAFFSAQGVSEAGEITDSCEEETALRRTMLRRAVKRVFLCDAEKAGKTYLYRLCHVLDVDEVVCDAAFPYTFEKRPSQDRSDG